MKTQCFKNNCYLKSLIYNLHKLTIHFPSKQNLSIASGVFLILFWPCFSYSQSYLVTIDKPIKIGTESIYENLDLHPRSLFNKISMNSERNTKADETIRYIQQIDGIPVIGAHLIETTNQNKSRSLFGKYVSSAYKVPKRRLSKQITRQALNYALNEIDRFNVTSLEITWTGEALVPSAFPAFSGLLYRCDVYEIKQREEKHFHFNYYVDNESGLIIGAENQVCQHMVPGKAKTLYNGTVDIETDSISPNQFVLRDIDRKISLVDRLISNDPDALNNDHNEWEGSNITKTASLDVFYATQRYYDYMIEKFNHLSYDGNGNQLNCVVNDGLYTNAYWSNGTAYFGTGDCQKYSPLVSIDIVGHEFTHGFTDWTSDLIYVGESGAINESLSDIFGKALEYEYKPLSFNWKLGESASNINGEYFRNMENPHLKEHPNFYLGQYWVPTDIIFNDNGGVHSNSGVINYWFYLLTNGRAGKNELGEYYNVEKLNWQEVLDLLYYMQTTLMTPSTSMIEFGNLSLTAAEELYGVGSMQFNSIYQSGIAVGILSESNLVAEPYLVSIYLENSFFQRQCINDFENQQLRLINSGATLTKGTTLKLNTNNQPELSFVRLLEKDIPKGDTLLFKGKIYLDSTDIVDNHCYFHSDLIIIDTANITTVINYAGQHNISFSDEPYNLQAQLSPVYNSQCDNPFQTQLGLSNSGCHLLSMGDSIKYEISTPLVSEWFKGLIIPNPYFDIFSSVNFKITESLKPYLGDSVKLSVYLKDPFTNEWTIGFSQNVMLYFSKPLTKDDYLDFSQKEVHFNYLILETPLLDRNFNIEYEVLNYSNRWDVLSPLCIDSEDIGTILENEYSYINFCVNSEDVQEPVLLFDIKQTYSTQFTTTEARVKSQIVNVEYGVETINASRGEQNEWRTQEIALPINYHDWVTIKVHCQGGEIDFDNIRLFDKTSVSTLDNNTDAESTISIFPNPSFDFLELNNLIDGIYHVKIYNTQGIKVYDELINDGQVISTAHLPSGYYTLLCLDESQVQKTASFVKF